MKFLWIKRPLRVDNLDGRPLPKEKEPRLKCDLTSFSFFLKSCVKTSWDITIRGDLMRIHFGALVGIFVNSLIFGRL